MDYEYSRSSNIKEQVPVRIDDDGNDKDRRLLLSLPVTNK